MSKPYQIGGRLLFIGLCAAVLIGVLPQTTHAATLDIQTFGAKCDGSDDAPAVQGAINALQNGDILVISCPTSIGAGGMLIANKTNIQVVSSSTGALRAIGVPSWGSAGGFGPSLFKLQNCDNCHVKDLTINANNLEVSGILLDASDSSTIENVTVVNVGCPGTSCVAAAGIVGDGNTNSKFIGNTVSNTSGRQTGNGVRGFWIRDNGTLISNNTVHDAGGTAVACNCKNAEISYNKSYNNAVSGIKLSGAGNPANGNTGISSIHHNLIYGNSQGITLEQIGGSNTQIYNNEAYGHLGDIIYGNGAPLSGITISDNYFHDNSGTAIKFLTTSSNILIERNRMHDNGLAVHLGELGGTYSGIVIAKNDLQGSGIWFQNPGKATSISSNVTNNAFHNIAGWAWTIGSGISGTISQSGNCFAQNGGNISDGRKVFANPPSSASCADPTGATTTPDTTLPILTNVVAASVNFGGATITWTTDEVADSVVEYGVTSSYGTVVSDPTMLTQHSVQLTNLLANTMYHYRVLSKDRAGNAATSTNYSFTTPGIVVPQGPFNAVYFLSKGNNDFQKVFFTRTDSQINFDWKTGSPDPKVPSDNFAVQWTGRTNFPKTGTYEFNAIADDGIKVWIDNVLVLDAWANRGTTTIRTFTRNLTAGNHLIVVHYKEVTGSAVAKFSWVLKPSSGLAIFTQSLFSGIVGLLKLGMPEQFLASVLFSNIGAIASIFGATLAR